MIPDVLETGMLLCFMAAWPMSTVKLWRSRTAKGTSLAFMVIIELGYLCGIASKLASNNVTYVMAFYVLNFSIVLLNIAIYFRNLRYDRASESRRPRSAGMMAATPVLDRQGSPAPVPG